MMKSAPEENRTADKAIILVGGWGTRLRPLTYTTPKPLVPFCNKPMIKYQIEKLANAGIKTIILAVNYYSELIMRECETYEQAYHVRIIYSKEDIPLGTAGPLALAKEYLKGSAFFVLNSDICSNADLKEMKEAFENSTAAGMIMTYPVNDPSNYGLIETDGNRITSFTEKPTEFGRLQAPYLINAGIYIFRDTVLDYIELKETSLEKTVFPKLLEEQVLLQYPLNGYWMDIGQIQDYLKGQQLFLLNESKSEKDVGYTSPMMDAEKNVVIGDYVTLGENILLENCTVFSGAVIGSNSVIRNSIVGWNCVIGENCYIEDVSALGNGVCVQNNVNIKAQRIAGCLPPDQVNIQ